MDIKQIQELIKFVSKSGASEVSIEQKDFKINIKTSSTVTSVATHVPVPMQVAAPQAAPVAAAAPAAEAPKAPAKENTGNLITIKSPMIGTFYRSSSPDKPAFINVGDEVKAGKVVCIIEAMKLFNEIESEVSGKVVKILVDNSSPVEYDQPLFLVEPA
jgi:acetyl-CoA carboxylase biotin carboxyl carrier protein